MLVVNFQIYESFAVISRYLLYYFYLLLYYSCSSFRIVRYAVLFVLLATVACCIKAKKWLSDFQIYSFLSFRDSNGLLILSRVRLLTWV